MTPDFCADETLFEEVRGTPGSWRQVRENLVAILSNSELENIRLEITDIASYSVDDPDELRRQHQELVALFPESPRASFHIRGFHNAAGRIESKLREKSDYRVCPYPWYSMYMGNNGDVVACCRDLEHQTVLGNLFEQSLDEVWNGERYQALRKSLASAHPEDHDACRDCDMPYDPSKFSLRNMLKTASRRLLLFRK
jgi:radical SAM protein with 4Fe4S-binding SPASM domain